MKSINDFLVEKQKIDAIEIPPKKDVKAPLLTHQISTGLTIAIDLSQIEPETLDVIFQDSGMFWELLDESSLKALYNELNPSLSFKEWLKENKYFKKK